MIEVLSAIAKMRDEMGEIPKSGYNPHYKYYYVTLEDLLGAIKFPLKENALLLHCGLKPDNGENILSVVVLHWESGEKVENSLVLPRGEKSLEWGADLVFYRRHLIALVLGLSLPTGERGKATSKPKPQQTPQLITPQQMEYLGERIAGYNHPRWKRLKPALVLSPGGRSPNPSFLRLLITLSLLILILPKQIPILLQYKLL